MTRDFTLEMYSELVLALKENYHIMSVSDYLTMPTGDAPSVVLEPEMLAGAIYLYFNNHS